MGSSHGDGGSGENTYFKSFCKFMLNNISQKNELIKFFLKKKQQLKLMFISDICVTQSDVMRRYLATVSKQEVQDSSDG